MVTLLVSFTYNKIKDWRGCFVYGFHTAICLWYFHAAQYVHAIAPYISRSFGL